jgi:hypothetical protein
MLSLPGLVAIPPALADEVVDEVVDEIDEVNAKNCIRIRSIQNSRIMDDRNIIFVMTGSKNYHNILPRECHGLQREGRFSYGSSSGSLCNLDNIRILYQGGRGLQEGNACRLGKFHLISDEDVDALMDREIEPLQAEPIPMPEHEDMSGDSEETGDETQEQ